MNKKIKPQILAPAGDRPAFLAALAAGADAIYCGLKHFSARMAAGNFSMEELSRLNALARSRGVKLHVAFNTLVKQEEVDKVMRILSKLNRFVRPHALIIQDPGVARLARHTGFRGEIHLSTLANCTFPHALEAAAEWDICKVVLPRELTIDEIKTMAAHTPAGMDLEVFIHGALCYAVSGRCYWSSFLGGRSSLRGRCVQPCRRFYRQENRRERYFSCLDFSADVLVKVLQEIPQVTTWKIEGRKKSPHYVFYTVKAYRLLRDQGHDPAQKKTALAFLDYAMGRPTTHYNLLSQRPQVPLNAGAETGSGLFVGRVKGGDAPSLITREALFREDLLRIGYEEDKGHFIQRITRSVPAKGKLVLRPGRGKRPRKGTPVFIIDRREPEVQALIQDLEKAFERFSSPAIQPMPVPGLPRQHPVPSQGASRPLEICLYLSAVRKKDFGAVGRWLTLPLVENLSRNKVKTLWWSLPPVVWPHEADPLQQAVELALAKGARHFILNVPGQIRWFHAPENLDLWAGPFCNIANAPHVQMLRDMGFSGAVVSPELSGDTLVSLPKVSCLPLGVVVGGNWPLAISRTLSPELKKEIPFTSPMGESAWVSQVNGNYWIFPGWRLNLSPMKKKLSQAGYRCFITLEAAVNKENPMTNRPGLWNWDLPLL